MTQIMKTFKVLGILLSYPSAQQLDCLTECIEILSQDKSLPRDVLQRLNGLINWMRSSDLLDIQEHYVELFDRTPSLSLHILEHIHGDSRDRGQALADLVQVYQDAGLVISCAEMPDYLPLFLEYLSTLPPHQSKENLDSIVNVMAAISQRLVNRESLYSVVFDAICCSCGHLPDMNVVCKAVNNNSGMPDSFEQVDAKWQEQFAFDKMSGGTSSNGCVRAEDMLSRMNIPKEALS